MKYIIAIICFISCAAVHAQTTKLLSTKDKDTLNHRIDSLKNRLDTLHLSGGGTVDLSNYYNKQGVDTAKDNLRAEIAAKNSFSGNADSLNHNPSDYYLDFNNLNNKPDLSGFASVSSLNNYLLKSDTANKWQPVGNYLTSINSNDVTTALGFTPYNSSNPNGFISAADLTPYAVISSVDTAKDNLRALIAAKPDSIDLIIDNNTIKGGGTNVDPLRVDTTVMATISSLNSYLLSATAASTYVAKIAGKQLSTEDYTTAEKTKLAGIAAGATNVTNNNQIANGAGYLTGITGSQVTTALGFTPYNATNPNGYLTATAITGKLNIVDTTAKWVNNITKNAAGDSILYFIGATRFALLDRGGTGGATTITDNLTTSTTGTALDAHQGFVLKGLIDGNATAISDKLTAGNNLSDLSSVPTARTNLGLGTLATQSGTFSGTSSGTNTGDETTARINALYGYTPANPANFQPLENQRLSTTNTPTFAGLTSSGIIKLIAQPGTPAAPAVGTQSMYADSTGAFTIQGSNGFALAISKNRMTANRRVYVQDKDYTLADSADVAANTVSIATNTTAIAGKLTASNNLSDLSNAATARTNLGFPAINTGYIPFGNGSTTFNSNNNLFWDNTNSRLGIGTASPAAFVHIISGITDQLRLGYDATNYITMNVNASAQFTLSKIGVAYMGTSTAAGGSIVFYKTILPNSTGSFDLGTSTLYWRSGYINSLNLGAGTTTLASLTIPAGTPLTTPASGAIENNGSYLNYTNSSNQRQIVISGTVVTGTGGTNKYLQTNIGGTTYYISLATALPN